MPIPLIAMGISGAVSAYGAHKASQNASNALDLQRQIFNKQSSLSDSITGFSKGAISTSQPAINKAMQYYMTLGGGNRGAIDAAIAPQVSQMNDMYSGAQRGMMTNMAPGAQRDQALADLYKQRTGAVSMLPMAARSNAIGNLSSMGTNLFGAGMSGLGAASNVLNTQQNSPSQQYTMSMIQAQPWQDFGKQMGGLLIPYLMQKGGGNSNGLPGFSKGAF